jgi:hypothetical protein
LGILSIVKAKLLSSLPKRLDSIQQNQQPTRSATWKPKYVEIEQGEEADCEEGKEVGFQNESGTIPSWQKLPKKYIPCHYHFRRPAKAEEDEADGEMSAMLLAMAAFLLKSLVLSCSPSCPRIVP